jgi:glutaminyl-tRNA synthetase
MENPPKGYFRLAPGTEVRLRYAYIIKCREVVRGTDGSITALRCTYDPETLGKNPSDGRKVKGIIHWVETKRALKAQVKLYDRLFTVSNPTGDKERDYREFLNPKSIEVIDDAMLEPSLATARPDDRFQFERLGYFCVDQGGPANGPMAFNRIVTLRDSWTKE